MCLCNPQGRLFKVNNNFMRPQQGNRNRNRNNRSRHRSPGSSNSGGGGGNSANKVFDSNGPDVKLRGTAQTVAEKYMQLGRDSQSSGDNVAAENYYQHAEHYYRIWASNQPVGQPLQMTRKLGEEEFEEESQDDAGDEEGGEGQTSADTSEGQEPQAEGQQQESQQRPARTNRDNRDNREGNRERFRPRWQNRRERFTQDQPEGQPVAPLTEATGAPAAAPPRTEEVGGQSADQWEAPSFLQRPSPTAGPAHTETAPEEAEAPRRARPRRERAEQPVVATDETTPEGE
jgi:hypothetical protein